MTEFWLILQITAFAYWAANLQQTAIENPIKCDVNYVEKCQCQMKAQPSQAFRENVSVVRYSNFMYEIILAWTDGTGAQKYKILGHLNFCI